MRHEPLELDTTRSMRIFVLVVFLAGLSPTFAGLLGSFQAGEIRDERVDPMPALFVAEGAPATSFLPAGPFEVTWTGELSLDKRSRVFFSFDGVGEASVSIKGVEALEESGDLGQTESKRLRLNAGTHPITISYKAPPQGDARFRLMWRGREFVKEPVPAVVFKTEATGSQALAGKHHVLSQKCVNCHQSEDVTATMGPALEGIGDRVSQEWLTRWISAPHLIKPGTTMPSLIDHKTAEGAQAAADVAAFLATLKTDTPVEPIGGNGEEGKVTFHELGCIGCHTAPNVSNIDHENSRIPLNNLASKYRGKALVKFLKNPRSHWDEIQMPDFQLSDAEANGLAAFLTEASTGHHRPDPSEFPPGDIARGKALTASLNCAACHTGLPAASQLPKGFATIRSADWLAKGCIAEESGNAPRLNLTKDEKEAVVAFSNKLKESSLKVVTTPIPAEFALHAISEQRCTTCHTDGDQGALLSTLHQESKRLLPGGGEGVHIDQSRPLLTHMGSMLHTKTIEKMLTGQARYRPWLKMRMPAFHHQAGLLAEGMSAMHGLAPSAYQSTDLTTEKAEIGKTLIGMQGGFACITCHGVGDQQALAAFEVQGLNFQHTRERLRKNYYMSWMDNPHRLMPGTKMPRYSLGKGKTALTGILEGSSEKQFEAIWEYFQTVTQSED